MLGEKIFFAVFQREHFKMVRAGVGAAVGGKQKIDAGDIFRICGDSCYALLQRRLRGYGVCRMQISVVGLGIDGVWNRQKQV